MTERRFKDIEAMSEGGQALREDAEAMEVEAFMDQLEEIESEVATTTNILWERVADGTLSENLLKRFALEYYWIGKWYTAGFGSLVAHCPDSCGFDLDGSPHFAHWLQNLADETGYAGDPNHVQMKIDWCRMLGIKDEDIMGYVPMPESIGSVMTGYAFMQKSYEEGLAAFGWAGERHASKTNYARMMYEGMRDHYGIEVENFRIHAYAEEDHGQAAHYLLKQVATTAGQQHRIRTAVRYTLMGRDLRNKALNTWLEEPGALRA